MALSGVVDLTAAVATIGSGVLGTGAAIAAAILTGISVYKKNIGNDGSIVVMDQKRRKYLKAAFWLQISVLALGMLAAAISSGLLGRRAQITASNLYAGSRRPGVGGVGGSLYSSVAPLLSR